MGAEKQAEARFAQDAAEQAYLFFPDYKPWFSADGIIAAEYRGGCIEQAINETTAGKGDIPG